MDTVVIYPGRFHPFHKGHKSVYDTLVKRFGKNRVFIATSDVVDPPKSPFTFEEKRAMIALTGIDPSRVIQTKSPYQATEITNNYDPQNTIALFAVSDKDMAEDPRFSFKPRQDGNPSYYQPAQKEMQGFDKHAYIVTVPTLQFGVLGEPMRSASEFRAKFANADERTQEKMIIDMFGKYDKKIHNIMSQKIVETLIRADEILDKLIEMGADDHYILEACRRVDALVESMQVNELRGNARLIRSPEEIDKRLTFIKPVRGLPNLITPKKPTRLMKRRAYSQMPEEIANFNDEDPMSSVIAIRGIGTMTIPQALDKVAEMSNMIAEIAKSNDAKNVQDNVPYYMNLLKTYNESIQEAYTELAQQRKRGGTKSRGIDPDITEQNSPERQKQIQQQYQSAGDAWAAGNRLSKNFSIHKQRWRMRKDPQVKQQIQKEDELTEKCWPGYEKKGMKTHYGKRVPNCVKKESK